MSDFCPGFPVHPCRHPSCLCFGLLPLSWTVYEHGRVESWKPTRYFGLLFSSGPCSMEFFEATLSTGQSLFFWSPRLWFYLLSLFPFLRFLNSTMSWSLQTRLFMTFIFPTSLFLFVSMRSRRAPAFFHSLNICVRKWPPMTSRNLLDCLCSAVLSFQGLKSFPLKIRACEFEASSVVQRMPCLLLEQMILESHLFYLKWTEH